MTVYAISSCTIDGTEYLSSMGWSGDVREAMTFELDDALDVANIERKKAQALCETCEYGEGRYQVAAFVFVHRTYTLDEYKDAEQVAEQMDALYAGDY